MATVGGIAGPAAAQELALAPLVDWVVVDKARRQLHLMAGNEAVRSYDIALGGVPQGPKLSAGDLRTPEGLYTIDGRNENSDFFLSLHISYPGPADLQRAAVTGVYPGSAIVIHGLPNEHTAEEMGHPWRDWTDGCIAVTNAEIVEIWTLVPDGTPIVILP